MDYYISWVGAELEYDVMQQHYTEEIKLLPTGKMHQYYENRIDGGKSVINRIPFDKNLCIQKPFKLHPDFDQLISGILDKNF